MIACVRKTINMTLELKLLANESLVSELNRIHPTIDYTIESLLSLIDLLA